jgi:TolA-binding protein
MTEAVIVAFITGGLSLVGVVITSLATSKKQEKAAAVAQAVMDTKLEELTREVREHNNFAQKMPAMQQQVADLERRVNNLEQYHKAPTN